MLPSESDGTRSASRPTGARLFVSDVTSPSLCTSVSEPQPPAGVPNVTMLNAGTVLLIPTVIDFAEAGTSGRAAPA